MSRIAIVNFNSGEISPELDARPDIEKYVGGCRKMENMIPDVFGNATKRPGTEFITIGGAGCYFEPPVIDATKIGISTEAELALIGNDVGYPMTGDYELRADLDFTGIVFWPIGRPVANRGAETVFEGTFDGRYHTISNISYDTTNHFINGSATFPPAEWNKFGLFGELSAAATVSNLTITNMTIECAWAPLPASANLGTSGFLFGTCTAGATITNCHTQGTISITASGAGITSGISTFGGMNGSGGAVFVRCSTDLVFNAGTAALPHGGSLSRVGGYCGSGSGASFTDCYAIGSITHTSTGEMKDIGGFEGRDGSTTVITNSYAAITLDGKVDDTYATVGGLIGYVDTAAGTYSDCFWDGDLTGTLDCDDPLGFTLYDIGHVGASTDEYGTGKDYVAGDDVANITKGTNSDGGANDMYLQATYTNWDFDTIWKINEGTNYPTFKWLDTSQNCIWTRD